MAHIGTFIARDKGFVGTLKTLTGTVALTFVPHHKETENAPDYRVLIDNVYEAGAAWKRISKADKPYLSVFLDAPSFPGPLQASLVENDVGMYRLLWSRAKGD